MGWYEIGTLKVVIMSRNGGMTTEEEESFTDNIGKEIEACIAKYNSDDLMITVP